MVSHFNISHLNPSVPPCTALFVINCQCSFIIDTENTVKHAQTGLHFSNCIELKSYIAVTLHNKYLVRPTITLNVIVGCHQVCLNLHLFVYYAALLKYIQHGQCSDFH